MWDFVLSHHDKMTIKSWILPYTWKNIPYKPQLCIFGHPNILKPLVCWTLVIEIFHYQRSHNMSFWEYFFMNKDPCSWRRFLKSLCLLPLCIRIFFKKLVFLYPHHENIPLLKAHSSSFWKQFSWPRVEKTLVKKNSPRAFYLST